MAHWIDVEEGTYRAAEAVLFTPANSAMALQDAEVEIYLDGSSERRVRGRAMAIGGQMVELLEDEDELHMLLDLGGTFKFLLQEPAIRAGKTFSPDVISLIYFAAKEPLQRLENGEYTEIRSRLTLLKSVS